MYGYCNLTDYNQPLRKARLEFKEAVTRRGAREAHCLSAPSLAQVQLSYPHPSA